MIKNYLKTAWRNLVRSRAFSAINIGGLALGMACSLLIFLWVQDERNVDGFHKNGNQLYQVYERNYYDGKVDAIYFTQGLLAEEMKRLVPEIQYACSMEQDAPYLFTFESGDKRIKLKGTFAGADFFRMFSYPLLQGSAEAALEQPGGIVISRKMAEQFFGSAANAMGKPIRYENRDNLIVTAVFEDLPPNSSLQFDFLRNWDDYKKQNAWVNSWGSSSPYTFIQLHKNADPALVGAKIRDFVHRYTEKTAGSHTELALQSFPSKYLHANFKNGQVEGGRIEYVRLFSLVAVFILLIASVNFMNLATARSIKRGKEVGIRKVAGASRGLLIGQFIGEALLLTFISALIAVTLAGILIPVFNELTGKELELPLSRPLFWMSLAGLLVVTGFVAGSYPALFLSSLHPNKVLKGTLRFGRGALVFRKGLVVFQFALSIVLIIGMIVVYRQIQYTQTKNLGYDRENLLYIPIEGDLIKNFPFFKERSIKLGAVQSLSKMKESPTALGHHVNDISWPGKAANLVVSFADATVGYDFISTMNLQLAEGHDFSREFGTDSAGYMINESAARKMGYQSPVGKMMSWGGREGKIIGLLKDFHFNSLHTVIEPLVVRLADDQKWGTILVRTRAGKTKEAIAGLESLCRELNPNYPFTYQFSDQEYAKLYRNEQLVSKLSSYFALLAIFISCLGLFGLAAFTAEQRKKEIGVRKVMGASVSSIIGLLSVNFLKPVAIAMLIAFPIAGYAMKSWLEGYAYKIALDWWVFALAGVATIIIALITVGYQSIRAAMDNPVRSLRSE